MITAVHHLAVYCQVNILSIERLNFERSIDHMNFERAAGVFNVLSDKHFQFIRSTAFVVYGVNFFFPARPVRNFSSKNLIC